MRTWETVLLLALALSVPSALAQEDPSLNESEMDTTPPPSDESYLDEAEAETGAEPTLGESEMDAAPPAYDESYLDEAEREIGGSGARATTTEKGTPGAPFALAVLGLAVVAAVLGRRR